MAQATWESLFAPNANWVRKGLFGSVLVQDYNPSNTTLLSNSYNPFDAPSGQLSSTLLTTDGWYDLGYLDDNVWSLTRPSPRLRLWHGRLGERSVRTLPLLRKRLRSRLFRPRRLWRRFI